MAGSTAWLEGLAGAPVPSRRLEDWRFTDLTALAAIHPKLAMAPDPLAGVTLPAGVSRLSSEAVVALLGRALHANHSEQHWLVQLNQGIQPAVVGLGVSGAAQPLELICDAGEAEGLVPWRILLVLEEGASLELLQVQRSSGANATTVITEVLLGAGSELRLGSLGLGDRQACLLTHLAVEQAPGSTLALTSASAGWALSRFEPRVVQSHGAAHTQMRSLQWVDDQQCADTHSAIRFDGPGGTLDQLHKAVADGAARSVFNGAISVPRAAQQTEASQLSRSLLLSDRARIDTKPQLEIVADDVRCAHGATVSRLQQDELFYLQSRGIAAAQASRLLLRGFCDEVLRGLPAAAATWRPLERLLGADTQLSPDPEQPAAPLGKV